MSDRFNYDVAAIVHPMSDVLVRVGIYQDKDVLEALSILREFADGENDQQEREGMHKVLDALEELYKSREEDYKPPEPPVKKERGHKRALTDEQVFEIRGAWKVNNEAWYKYRSNPSNMPEPHKLTMTDLAARYRVSAGVIQHVIDQTRAYKPSDER